MHCELSYENKRFFKLFAKTLLYVFRSFEYLYKNFKNNSKPCENFYIEIYHHLASIVLLLLINIEYHMRCNQYSLISLRRMIGCE